MTSSAPGFRKDPYAAFRFHVEIDGILAGGFSQVSGIELELQVESYEEGGVNHFTHHLVKSMRFPNLVLTRGLLPKHGIWWDWMEQVRQGRIERRSGRLIVFDAQHEGEHDYFSFTGACPVRLRMSDLDASSNTVATEALELAHHGILRSRP